MKAVEMKKGVYWVGGIDWDLRNFHGYLTQRGSTYNAYLIIDEKITLIDTVKHYLYDEMIKRISQIIDPKKIDIVVSNHVEMDHSGGLPQLLKLCPNAQLFTSPSGEKGLKAHFGGEGWNFKVVKTGDKINIGKQNLQFVLAPMVHWPDNMMVYLEEEKILFSNDAFGQHIASYERFDDEYYLDIVMEEAKKYYANIVLPYDTNTQKAFQDASKLDIKMVAPSHGIIWRKNVGKIFEAYQKWMTNQTENHAVIIYDTMWKSTEKIAYALAEEMEAKGVAIHIKSLQTNHISDIMTCVQTAKYIFVGSPTLNNNILPNVAAFLTYMKGLHPKNRIGMAFGSYGWGGQSVALVEGVLQEMGMEVLPNIRIQYIPDTEKLKEEVKTKLSQIS